MVKTCWQLNCRQYQDHQHSAQERISLCCYYRCPSSSFEEAVGFGVKEAHTCISLSLGWSIAWRSRQLLSQSIWTTRRSCTANGEEGRNRYVSFPWVKITDSSTNPWETRCRQVCAMYARVRSQGKGYAPGRKSSWEKTRRKSRSLRPPTIIHACRIIVSMH